jgi:hypothetical protein
MSTAMKVLVAFLAILGLIAGVYLILGILHWIFVAAVVLGVVYVGYKIFDHTRKPKSLAAGGDPFQMQLKSFDMDLTSFDSLDAKSGKPKV